MAMEAPGEKASLPSGSNEDREKLLKEADGKFEMGILCIKKNDTERAVELFGDVLETRTKFYGEMSVECASAYYRYGSSLFYRAQDEADIFGEEVAAAADEKDFAAPAAEQASTAADDDKENVTDAQPSTEAEKIATIAIKGKEEELQATTATTGSVSDSKPEQQEALQQQQKQEEPQTKVEDRGKAPAEDQDGTIEDPDAEGHGDEEDDGDAQEDGGGGEEVSDMEMAWQMLELARSIYTDHKEGHQLQLADVHMLLGDISMENEAFDQALTDYDASVALLKEQLQADDRRIAEVHYKQALALQFLDQFSTALQRVKEAMEVMQLRISNKEAAARQEGKTDADKAEIGKEVSDLKGLLEDLKDKVEELQEIIQTEASTKDALKAAFAAVGGGEPSGFSSNSAAAAGASGEVKDLGVVGRGRKRITPVATSASTAAGPGKDAAKPKRTLEDLMGGGDDSEALISFNRPASLPTMPEAKKVKPVEVDPATATGSEASIPAFLQPQNVSNVYGTPGDASDKKND